MIRETTPLPAGLLLLGALACAPAPSANSSLDVAETLAESSAEIDPAPPPIPSDLPSVAGTILLDGSSTAFPILEAAAMALLDAASELEIRLGVSGTSSGFRKFCRGEIDVADASRDMYAEELAQCAAAGIDPVRIAIAFDGVSLVVPAENTWCECLELDDLRRIWSTDDDRVRRWSEIDPSWPDLPIRLFGPGLESGTADFFIEAVLGGEHLRNEVSASEDDYLIAQSVADDSAALGFFGYSYAQEYSRSLRLVAVDGGRGCALPEMTTLSEGRYQPLSRQLAIYLDRNSLRDPAMLAFLRYFFTNVEQFVGDVGAIPLPSSAYERTVLALSSDSPERAL